MEMIGNFLASLSRYYASSAWSASCLRFRKHIAVLEELGRGDIEGKINLVAELVARLFNRLEDEFKGLLRSRQIGAKPPSSPTLVLWPLSWRIFQAVKDFRAQRSASVKGGRASGITMNSWKSMGASA